MINIYNDNYNIKKYITITITININIFLYIFSKRMEERLRELFCPHRNWDFIHFSLIKNISGTLVML